MTHELEREKETKNPQDQSRQTIQISHREVARDGYTYTITTLQTHNHYNTCTCKFNHFWSGLGYIIISVQCGNVLIIHDYYYYNNYL